MRYFLMLLFVLVVLVALVAAAPTSRTAPTSTTAPTGRTAVGGHNSTTSRTAAATSRRQLSPHVIVDTLNLSYWLHGQPPTPALIASTIDQTAESLHSAHAGRIVYVLKDRDSQFNSEAARVIYQQAADRNKVTVCIAERYSDPPAGNRASGNHSARGRDDFYTAILAARYRCAVLTADNFQDFDQFRSTLSPFHVLEFTYWRNLPAREFIRPESPQYFRLRKPKTIPPSKYFVGAQAGRKKYDGSLELVLSQARV